MSKATKKFKDDPYVKEYYRTANEIQARQNGLIEDVTQTPAAQQPPVTSQPAAPDSMQLPPLSLPQK